jgi:uncharacterized protein YjiS (DUF1127 family)
MTDLAYRRESGTAAPFATLRRSLARLRRLAGAVRLWRARQRQRNELVELPPHLLFDIGLTRADVEQEARRLPWQQPSLANRNRIQSQQPRRD